MVMMLLDCVVFVIDILEPFIFMSSGFLLFDVVLYSF